LSKKCPKTAGRSGGGIFFYSHCNDCISMVIGDRHSFLSSGLFPPFDALPYTDFDVLGFHRTASAQKQTTTDNNCRTSTF